MLNGEAKTEGKKTCLYLAPTDTALSFEIFTELKSAMVPNPSSTSSADDDIVNQFLQVLEDLKEEKKVVAIQICPQCKSPRLRNRETWYDIGGAMGISPPRYRCLECGYLGRVIIEATNIDLDEEVLDDLVHRNLQSAQKLLKDLQQKLKERSK